VLHYSTEDEFVEPPDELKVEDDEVDVNVLYNLPQKYQLLWMPWQS